ncbi:hypothetical protein ACFLR4_03810 [Bacteroidota bacterium]
MMIFNSFRILAVLLLLSPIFFGCNYDTLTDADDVRILAEPLSSYGMINGIVTDQEGNPIINASVHVGNNVTNSNDMGYFALSGLPRNERTIVKFRKRDYVPTDKYCNVRFGESILLNIPLTLRSEKININSAVGGTLADEDLEVVIPPYAFLIGNNSIFQQTLDYAATYIKSSSDQYTNKFSGEFLGSPNSSGTLRAFESFGLMELKYNLREGIIIPMRNIIPANITITIPEELQANPPENLTTWYYDSAAVRWYEEGMLTREGNNYIGTTSHFTYLTWGNYFHESYLTGQAVDINGNAITNGSIISDGLSYSGNSSSSLDENGNFTIRVKPASSVSLQLLANGSKSTPFEIDNTPLQGQTQDLGDVTFNNTIGSITLLWGMFPDDLDSHLLVPASNTGEGPFHINFAERGDLYTYPLSNLRKDDNDSYGPEVIDLGNLVEGKYIYFVHNVSGENDGAFTYSNALVKLEINNSIYLFEIPQNNEESCNAWHVFDLLVDSNGGCEVVLKDEMIDKRTLLSENSMNKYSASPK